MNILLETNQQRFYGDLSEVLRLYIPECSVWLPEDAEKPEGFECRVSCMLEGDVVTAKLSLEGEYGCGETIAGYPGKTPLLEKKLAKRGMKHSLYCALRKKFGFDPPWGCLTGIRPTKLMREFLKASGEAEARRVWRDYFCVSEDKLKLALDIVGVQKSYIESVKPMDFDVYIGIPFCRTRCAYCSFAAYELGKGVATADNIEKYVALLTKEIARDVSMCKERGYNVRSVYIGGGTPTSLDAGQLERVLEAAAGACGSWLEFTVEAGRPDTIDEEKLRVMRKYGVDRISINPQSMNSCTLERIGRSHTPEEIIRAFDMARSAGFKCINMDTIIGLPGETPDMVKYTMEQAEKLRPENLTVHTLAIKRSSRLREHIEDYPLPGAGDAAEMLELGIQAAKRMGQRPYYMYRQKYMSGNLENIGFALPGMESVYNIDIMEETASILALGAGAITKWVYDGGERIVRAPNPKDIATYFEKSAKMHEQRIMLLESGGQMS